MGNWESSWTYVRVRGNELRRRLRRVTFAVDRAARISAQVAASARTVVYLFVW